jgi:hypothetical protein
MYEIPALGVQTHSDLGGKAGTRYYLFDVSKDKYSETLSSRSRCNEEVIPASSFRIEIS